VCRVSAFGIDSNVFASNYQKPQAWTSNDHIGVAMVSRFIPQLSCSIVFLLLTMMGLRVELRIVYLIPIMLASRIVYLIHCHVCVCMCAWHGVCVCVCFHVRVFVRVCVLFGLTGLNGPFFSCHDLHVGPIMVATRIVYLIPIMLANRIVYLIHPCKIC